ncbi:hypothetical protein COCOBI_13-0590 [Coccomyxa sp. Obi]|nr:hypothetical protein COCOBI_13-0590 [Coccomyxa sp. Obi]
MVQLCNRRIDYYFAAITKETDKMARIMKECYVHSHTAKSEVMDWKDANTSFAPLIINSVNSSMLRSAAFNRMVDSAESKLSNSSKGKGFFQPIVG